jgi:hypothetical protein
MPKTPEQKIQLDHDAIRRQMAAADEWRRKGEPGMELVMLFHAGRHHLSIAVRSYDSPDSGAAYLKGAFRTVFDRAHALLGQLLAGDAALLRPWSPPGIDSPILFVHSAWMLHLPDAARTIASIFRNKACAAKFQTAPFWSEYARAISCVTTGSSYEPIEVTAKGYDKHMVTYLPLMADICASCDRTPSCVVIDEGFEKRNRDKRLMIDAGPDACGTFPVLWDFRKHSLLNA